MRPGKLIMSLLILTGFFCTAQTGVVVIDSMLSSGIYRKYALYIPNSYDSSKAVPLVIDLHDLSSTPGQQQSNSDFMSVADTAGFMVLNPQGTSANPYWNAGLINGSPFDVQFISDVIDSLDALYFIDNNKIYACGMGNGGIMSYYLACNLPAKITAIASVAGTMYGNWFNACKPYRTIPVMEIHGTQDAVIPYEGSTLYVPVDSVIKKWSRHNKCSVSPATFTVPNSNTSDNSTAVNYLYQGGIDNSTVELYKISGGSHSWPGSIPVVPNTNLDFKASVEIWRFFRQFKLNQFVTNVGLMEYKNNLSLDVYPNPVTDRLIVSEIKNAAYSITDATGKNVMENTTDGTIEVTNLIPGIYCLRI